MFFSITGEYDDIQIDNYKYFYTGPEFKIH